MSTENATLKEILNQPQAWQNSLDHLAETDFAQLVAGLDVRSMQWVFVGCGTSFYLAQAAAFSMSSLLGVSAHAIPASEIMLFPSSFLFDSPRKPIPVLISRSGHTSEVLQVAEFFQSRDIEFLAITCDGRELSTQTNRLIKLPICEQSTVMTSSFTAMLIALQYLAATLAQDDAFVSALRLLPNALENLLQKHVEEVRRFAKRSVEDVAFLGQGALYAIAAETSLKVMESSSTYAQFFHTLEFRHGPKSIVGPDVLVGALISETGQHLEVAVLREMKELGATTFSVANTVSEELRTHSDLSIELSLPIPELARIAAYVVWGQLLGAFRGFEKGLNPDSPRNLDRVVTI
jgi:glucosamine--fructose-6-phosphate aminotransferase (isomerizing)